MLRENKTLVDGAVCFWMEWNEMKITVWKARTVVEAGLLLRKEVRCSKHKVKFVVGKERTGGSSCQWISVLREAIGEAIFFEWELARLEELASGHGLKKIYGNSLLFPLGEANDLSIRNGLRFLFSFGS